jgi:hypothetical protein
MPGASKCVVLREPSETGPHLLARGDAEHEEPWLIVTDLWSHQRNRIRHDSDTFFLFRLNQRLGLVTQETRFKFLADLGSCVQHLMN